MRHPSLSLLPVRALLMALLAATSLAQAQQSGPAPLEVPPPPASKDCTPPVYPMDARRWEIQGTVTLSFLVGIDGLVHDSKVLKSSGSRQLDETARVALAKCRFRPGMGQTESAWVQVRYTWRLD